ncbi:MAG: hypothetical protein AUH85_00010 [Chloroflexi bacterium 13_1_40CM_4_68_4]|nr:MAG: hypothetical protein AUH85_00010 [Chloroflexi bacterium 13_1_40CM_4_68_4]
MNTLTRWILLAAACNQITTIVTESLLFKPVRERIAERSSYLGELVSCHLCFGTWVGIALATLFRPRLVPGIPVISTAVEGFAIAFGGRVFNEVTGLLKREVRRTEEETKILEEVSKTEEQLEASAS